MRLNLTISMFIESDHTKVSTNEDFTTQRIRKVTLSSLAKASFRRALTYISIYEAYVTDTYVTKSDESIGHEDEGEASDTQEASHGKEKL